MYRLEYLCNEHGTFCPNGCSRHHSIDRIQAGWTNQPYRRVLAGLYGHFQLLAILVRIHLVATGRQTQHHVS